MFYFIANSIFQHLGGRVFCTAAGPGCERKFIPLQNDAQAAENKEKGSVRVRVSGSMRMVIIHRFLSQRRARARAVS